MTFINPSLEKAHFEDLKTLSANTPSRKTGTVTRMRHTRKLPWSGAGIIALRGANNLGFSNLILGYTKCWGHPYYKRFGKEQSGIVTKLK
jgi:hypothetical protein